MSIFSETTCLKSELLNKIIELMVASGWKNISSDPTTDFVVMQSAGESGDKNLVFQIRSTATNNANDIVTTASNIMSYRLIGNYIPGEEGVAGVTDRPKETWRALQIAPGAAVDPSVELTLWYSVNKDRIIFNIYTPESLNLGPVLFYIGLPTTFTSEPDSRGLIFMTSHVSPYSNQVHITDNVAELPSLTTSTSITNLYAAPPKSPNSAGLHTPFELAYGNTSVGKRGQIDSLLFLPNNSINDGDIVNAGSKRYRGTLLALSSNNSFPVNCILYRIS